MKNTLRNLVAGTILGASLIAGSLGLEGCASTKPKPTGIPAKIQKIDSSYLSDSELDAQLYEGMSNLYQKVFDYNNRLREEKKLPLAEHTNTTHYVFAPFNDKENPKTRFHGGITRARDGYFVFNFNRKDNGNEREITLHASENRVIGDYLGFDDATGYTSLNDNKKAIRKEKEEALQMIKQMNARHFFYKKY